MIGPQFATGSALLQVLTSPAVGRGSMSTLKREQHQNDEVVRSITVKEHSLVVMVVILVGDLLLAVSVSLPELLVHHLLDLQGGEPMNTSPTKTRVT